MFEDMTPEKIRGRILGRLKTDLQTREGSFTNDLIAAAAEELSEAYHSLDALIPAFYVDETSGPYIDKQAGTVGIVRKAGTKARCGVTFTGADGAAIPAGAVYYTASGLAFYLEAPVTLRDGAGEGTLLAAEPGDAYNIAAGEIVTALRNYSGVSDFTNSAADGGADPETDGALLGRYLERMRKPATSGNPWHYQRWAKEVEGVGAARIVSKWNGPGTVKVIVADQDLQPATAAAVSACAAHIEEERPIGPSVTVEAAKTLEVTVEAAVTLESGAGASGVRAALEEAVTEYLRTTAASAFGGSVDLQFEAMDAGAYSLLFNRVAFLLLPQDFGYYPDMKAGRYLHYLAELKALPPELIGSKTQELLQMVELYEARNKKIRTFSGGMLRRLGIAQAMLNDPEILILDEPTAGLDPKERIRFRNIISAFSRNRIVILSTHIVSDVEYIADRILLMKQGELILQGNLSQVTEKLRGCVWECTAQAGQAEALNERYAVSNLRNCGDKVSLRIVAEEKPTEDALPAEPNLEDVYLYYFTEKESREG